jgi:hypothetical protein
VFDRLRDALRAALEAASPGDLRELSRRMREAVMEAGAAVQEMREGLARTERELAAERQRVADTERRGRLAAEIQDGETVDVAQRFATKHRERVSMLERKLVTQREELALAERDRSEMQAELARAERDRPTTEAERSAARAWRELREAGGGERAETDLQGDLLRADLDAAARDAAAERQLRELKQRVKKD